MLVTSVTLCLFLRYQLLKCLIKYLCKYSMDLLEASVAYAHDFFIIVDTILKYVPTILRIFS